MEIAEIFRFQSERGLLRSGSELRREYRALADVFHSFERALREPPSVPRDFPSDGYTFTQGTSSEHAFAVHFCGKEISFCFDVVRNGREIRGIVTCIAKALHGQFEATGIGHFSFGDGGFTDIDPGDRGPLKMDEWDGAKAILLAFMTAAFDIQQRVLVRIS